MRRSVERVCLGGSDANHTQSTPQALRRRREGEIGREMDREGEEGGPGPP